MWLFQKALATQNKAKQSLILSLFKNDYF